ncbi:MAG TPA: dipeptide/oligopeptide/nickel ABC transporter ATP-binding protein [Candidatus Acidoferrum sp.]|jgi:peptide/nickel transport system ATP-binding protein
MIGELRGASQALIPLLSVRGLSLAYARRRLLGAAETETFALRDVSFDLREGETLALVGPSGSGKSSLARCLVLLETPSAGGVFYKGEDISLLRGDALNNVRKEIHLIFQDAASALNPRLTVEEIVAEPLMIHKMFASSAEVRERVRESLEQVELGRTWAQRRPRELSGGQRQRVAIARALVLRPKLLILDEALSSLDVSTQAQIANLLLDLQERHALSYLFVTHDVRMAGVLATKVAVLEAGRIVRRGLPAQVLTANLQPVA